MTIDIRIHTAAQGSEAQLDRALEALAHQLKGHADVKFLVQGASFFTMPEPDTQRVLVSIVGWNGSAPATLRSFDQVLPGGVTLKAKGSFTLSDVDAPALVQHVQRSSAMEVAIRTPQAGQDEAFLREREHFFGLVRQQPGFVFEQELRSVDGPMRAVLIGWKDRSVFMQALGVLGQAPEMGSFFSTIDVHAYQAFERS
ncbi:MAG TPA: hypothetical protein PKE21_04405 [Flavobacteriales bacterium]|nr:hypothetical protein [Flavobacteriales bacterium]HMR26701.1 hypothetical protein [Flavobacteriales bacterium]